MEENLRQLAYHNGEYFEYWRYKIGTAFGAVLDERKPPR